MIDLTYVSKEFLSIFNTYFIMAVSCMLYIFSNKDKQYKEMICLMFLTMLYNSILKEIFKLPLPETCRANCYSFPSGHMNFQSIFYIWMILKNKNNLLRVILLAFWIITGTTMVFAGYHFARDVIITPIFSLSFILLFKYISRKLNNENNTNLILLITAFVFSLINCWIAGKFQYHVSLALQSIYALILFDSIFSKKMSSTIKFSLTIIGAIYLILAWNKHSDLYLLMLESRFFFIYSFVVFANKFWNTYILTKKII